MVLVISAGSLSQSVDWKLSGYDPLVTCIEVKLDINRANLVVEDQVANVSFKDADLLGGTCGKAYVSKETSFGLALPNKDTIYFDFTVQGDASSPISMDVTFNYKPSNYVKVPDGGMSVSDTHGTSNLHLFMQIVKSILKFRNL